MLTTPLLNKLTPEGAEGRIGGGREGGYCAPRRGCRDFINFCTTTTRTTFRPNQTGIEKAETSSPTNSQIKRQ